MDKDLLEKLRAQVKEAEKAGAELADRKLALKKAEGIPVNAIAEAELEDGTLVWITSLADFGMGTYVVKGQTEPIEFPEMEAPKILRWLD